MRKILTLLVIISLTMQSFCVAYADTELSSEQYASDISFLQALEIMYEDKDIPTDTVTRENFALYIARALKLDEFKSAYNRYFNDLDMDGYTTSAINSLTEKGIISQNESHKFRPTDPISGAEACKLIMSALGYGEYCELSGGYPSGYTSTASKLDIDIKGATFTVAEAAAMIVEAVQAPIYTIEGVDANGIIYSNESDESILSLYWGIVFTEGTVRATRSGTLDGNYISLNDRIVVEDSQYSVSESINADEYLGSYVKIFFLEDEEKVLYIEDNNRLESVIIDVEDFVDFDGDKVEYYNEAEKVKHYDVKNANLIYNGMPLTKEIQTTLANLNKGSIVIKDSDNDRTYDTVIIEDYDAFVVSRVDVEKEIIYNEIYRGKTIEYGKADATIIETAEGDAITVNDIKQFSVLSVAESKNKEIIKIIVSDDEKSGVVESMSDYDGFELGIDGVLYKVDKEYAQEENSRLTNLSLGNNYIYRLDAFGEIAYISTGTTGAENLGYIIHTHYEAEPYGTYIIRMLTTKNEIETFTVSEKVEIDGTRDRNLNYDKFVDALTNNGSVNQLVRYELSSDNEIVVIDTQKYVKSKEDSKNTLISVYGDTDTKRWYNNNRLGIKGVMGESTLLFCIPYDTTNTSYEDYRVCAPSALLVHDGMYYADAYRSSDEAGFESAVVCRYTYDQLNKNFSSTRKSFLVADIRTGVNEAGDVVTILSGYETGAKTEYQINTDEISIDGIEVGDLVLFSYGINGEVVPSYEVEEDYIMLYDYSEGGEPDPNVWKGIDGNRVFYTLVNDSNYSYYRAGFQLSFGYVSAINDKVISWGALSPEEVTERATTVNIPIVIVDDSGKKIIVESGTIEDIDDFKTVGSECSRIIYQAYSNLGRAIYIYK